jgi:hypothetical protein
MEGVSGQSMGVWDGNRATEGGLQDREEIIQIGPETLEMYAVSAQSLEIS